MASSFRFVKFVFYMHKSKSQPSNKEIQMHLIFKSFADGTGNFFCRLCGHLANFGL